MYMLFIDFLLPTTTLIYIYIKKKCSQSYTSREYSNQLNKEIQKDLHITHSL